MAQQQPDQPGLLPLPLQQLAIDPAPNGVGNRRGGGRQRGRGRGRDAQTRPPRQPNPLRVGPPRPTHLQATPTPDRNDPLWTTGVAGAELQPMPRTEWIYPGAEALPEVIAVMYASYVSASPGFSRRICESAFAYYCGVCTYARFLSLQSQNSLLVTADEERFVSQVLSLPLEVPILLSHFLAGFGNTCVPSGRDIKFRMFDRPDYQASDLMRGWFGRVSADTQKYYQLYPCLAVYGSRLLADLSHEVFNRDWDVPLTIVPIIPDAIGPSTALLGWSYRSRLQNTQYAFLEGLGLFADDPFPSVNPSLPLSLELMMAVQNELRQVSTLKLSPMPTALVGSQAQLGRISFEEELLPLVSKTVQFECSYQLPAEVSFPASAFAYRVYHATDLVAPLETAPWVVWRFHPGNHGWDDLVAAGNAARDEESEFLNAVLFRTTFYLLRSRLETLERAVNRSG